MCKVVLLAGALAVSACGDGGGNGSTSGGAEDVNPVPIVITGQFNDGLGQHIIDSVTWTQHYEGSEPSQFRFVQIMNEARYAVAQNSAENAFHPDRFSRFDWVWSSDGLYYCQSAYDAETAEAASAAQRPDDTSPATEGCGGMFPWSLLTPATQVPFVGRYGDGFGEHVVTANLWAQTYDGMASRFVFTQIDISSDDLSGVAIARNGDGNEFNSGKWSRFDWVTHDGATWYCQTAFDAESPDIALAVDAPEANDVAASGCGGMFPWTRLGLSQ